MKTIKLGSLITISKGKKHTLSELPSSQSIRMLGIDDLRNDTLIRMTDDKNGVLACDDDVLIAWDGANAGTIGFGKQGYIGSTISRLRLHDTSKYYAPFIGMFLQSNFNYLRKTSTGATIPHINRNALESIPVPVFAYNDQIRIATLLSKVENLISRRREQLKQLDELLKSVFLEMFGDPVRNEKGWQTVPFSRILKDIESGWSPVCEARAASSSEWGVLKLGAITSCVFKDDENKALLPDVQPKTKNEVQIGDLLFSRKNTYDLVAACVYVFNTRSKLMISDLIFRFVFNDDSAVTPLYIWKLLINDSQRKKIQSLAGGAAGSMPNISKANLRNIQIPLPPLDLQNRFSDIVIKVETLKAHYTKSLSDLEGLYGTLSQKAFNGELDLSRVPIATESEPVI
jgi:type I restriction enzyme, S subunit